MCNMETYSFTPETKDQVIADTVDIAIEKYAQFLGPKRQELIASKKYYGMGTTRYGDATLFRVAMRDHAMEQLDKGKRHVSMSMDYYPEEDLLAVTDRIGISAHGVFPSKSHVWIDLFEDCVRVMWHLEAPYI